MPASSATLADRTRKEFADEDIAWITGRYRSWRGALDSARYEDQPGFCKPATLEEMRKHKHVLTPGRYDGAAQQDDDIEPFEHKLKRLVTQLCEQQAEGARLDAAIEKNLELPGLGGLNK